jgi:hypothetical protein
MPVVYMCCGREYQMNIFAGKSADLNIRACLLTVCLRTVCRRKRGIKMYLDQKIAIVRDKDHFDELTIEETFREYMLTTDYPSRAELIDKAIMFGADPDEVPTKEAAADYFVNNIRRESLIFEMERYGGIITVYNYLASGMTEEEYEEKVQGKVVIRDRFPGSYKGSAYLNVYFIKQYLIWRETGEITDDFSYSMDQAKQWQNEAKMDAMLRRKHAGK